MVRTSSRSSSVVTMGRPIGFPVVLRVPERMVDTVLWEHPAF